MPTPPKDPVLSFATADAWNTWLATHHTSDTAILLRIAKGKSTADALTYAQALDVALAWGWIDSQKRGLDDTAWLQRFSRRTPRSPWSKINCAKAEALIAARKMQPAGLKEVERAKQDGRWERAYHGSKNSTVPDDFNAALQAKPRAAKFFAELDAANRYAFLHRLQNVKRAETRLANIERFVAMCVRGEALHPLTKRSTSAKKRSTKP